MRILINIFGCLAVSFLMFNSNLKVQASEIQMEEREKENLEVQEEFDIGLSEMWTSEGKTIKAYDVSEKEQIAIAFSNNTISVFDKNMQFQYEITFDTSGSYGVLWNNENVMFVDIRSDIAVEFNEFGEIMNSYMITGPSNYGFDIVFERIREKEENRYLCTNQSMDMPSVHFNYYTQLKKYDLNGVESIIYESEQKLDGIWFGILVLLCVGVMGGTTAIIIGIHIIQRTNKGKSSK